MPAHQSFFLFGPRTTGKSTLIKQYLEHNDLPSISYDLLNTDTFLRLHAQPWLLRHELEALLQKTENNILQAHIDEVQKIPQLLDEIHSLIESHPGKMRFLLSGSSARKLKRGGANLLAGRAWQRRLYPLSFLEIGKNFSLAEALQFGTLAPILDRPPTEKIEQLKSYVNTYLKEEIQAEALTRRLDSFHRFLEAAASSNGALVNMTKVAQESACPRKTAASYYQILEDTLIGFFLDPWGHRLSRKALVTHGKFYFFDPGIVAALQHNLSAPIHPKNPLFGHLFEHFCLLEFIRIHDYKRTEHRFGFFRTRAGAEVDLVEERGDKIRAIEIKATATVARGDLRGLQSFTQEFPQAQQIVVCLAPKAFRIGPIECLPWQEFFEREQAASLF